jgi:hypothetical protein
MKLYFTIFLFLTFKVYGQAPLDIKSYLDSKQVSKAAKDFYYGKFKATDDTKTFSIIDSLKTKNNLTRPFYIFLVSKIIDKADGALSESLGVSCKDFIESHPDFLIDFLYSKSTIVDKRFLGNWANQIAGEFMIDCEGKEKQCIKKSLQKASTKIKLDNKSKLTAFYHKIESYCH